MSRGIRRRLTTLTGIDDGLRLYGLVEVLVGLSALLTVAAGRLPGAWEAFPYRLVDGIWMPSLPYQVVQVAGAMGCVFVPCLFMGVTFPLLCDTFKASHARGEIDADFPSRLYTWNTLGAGAGVIACQFVLILWFGHWPTLWLMVALNLAIGVYFLVTGGAPAAGPPSPAAALDAPTGPAGSLIAAAVLGGLLTGALEGDLFRRISFVIVLSPGATMSFVSFWAIVGIFLASAAVTLVGRVRLPHIKGALVLAVMVYAVQWRYCDDLTYLIGGAPVPGEAYHFPVTLAQLFLYTGVYVLPVFFLASLLLPYVCNRLQDRGQHLGLAYGLNTVAFCLGLFAFSFLAPAVNIFYSLKLFFPVMALVTVGLLALDESRPLRPWLPAGLAILTGVATLTTPRAFDPDFFTPAMWSHTLPPTELRGSSAETTYVLELPDRNLRLFFGRLSMSGTSAESQAYMRLMAHVPLLIHPHPETALLICFGVGNTASAIAAHEAIRQIDVVDLSSNVLRTAPAFRAFHGNVQLDPRLRMISDDGRSFLRHSDSTYDLITSEPPPPLSAGVYRLYSREYYGQVLAHLNPDGLMTQWLPMGQLPARAIELVVRTFVGSFPHSLVFVGSGDHLILMGSPAPIDPGRLATRFPASGRVLLDLGRIGVFRSGDLTRRVLMSGPELRDRLGPGRVLSDQHNDLEHLLYDPAEPRLLGDLL